MYLMRTMTDTALKGIGAVLGGKDHSTVKYGVEKIAKDIESDEMMAEYNQYNKEENQPGLRVFHIVIHNLSTLSTFLDTCVDIMWTVRGKSSDLFGYGVEK